MKTGHKQRFDVPVGAVTYVDIGNVTMAVGDWGGPIGPSWALHNPNRVQLLIATNTWLWPVNRSLYYQVLSKAIGSLFDCYTIGNHNLFAERVVKSAWGKATPLAPVIDQLCTGVHPIKGERKGMGVFPAEITGSTARPDSLWRRRETLHQLEMTFLWGRQDVAFRPDVLEK